MRKLLAIALLGFGMVSMNAHAQVKAVEQPLASAKSSVNGLAQFSWGFTEFDFGTIPQGQPQTKVFQFENTGDQALVISNVQSSCGCTVADYSKEPVLPGQTGYVKLTYNAANKGAFNKVVTITANTEPNVIQLKVRGNVN